MAQRDVNLSLNFISDDRYKIKMLIIRKSDIVSSIYKTNDIFWMNMQII